MCKRGGGGASILPGKTETVAPDFPGKMTISRFDPTFPPVPP